jgi:uncharacterized protein (TIGR02285 family)
MSAIFETTLPKRLRLFMRREMFEKLGRPKRLSLQTLFENDYGVLAVTKERSYGKFLDNIIKQFEKSDNIQLRSTLEQKSSAFSMLGADRVDFLIEYLESEDTTEDMHNIVEVPLGKIPEMVFGHVACAKTEWGAKAIKAINKAIVKLRPTVEYRRAYERTLNADQAKTYRKKYSEEFLKSSE